MLLRLLVLLLPFLFVGHALVAACYGIPHRYLGRVVPLCASNGGVAGEVPWTVASPAHHVDGLPLSNK